MKRLENRVRGLARQILVGTAAGVMLLGVLGCETTPKKAAKPDLSGQYVFWPTGTVEPRVQFVRYFQSASDLSNKKQSAFDKVVFGEDDPRISTIDKPYGVDAAGARIYVCDIRRRALTVLDLKKKEMRLVGVTGVNRLMHPVDVAAADDGQLYVADNEAKAVFVYDRNERYARTIAHDGFRPVSVAVYGQRLYVCNMETQQVEIFDRESGALIKSFGEVGDGDGQFRVPLGVDVDKEGNVFVSDMMRCRVQKFTPDGEYIAGMGTLGDYAGSFARPKQMAVDSDGIIYVVDAAFQNVQMFSPDFELLMEFGAAGTFPGAMNLPVGICTDDETMEYLKDLLHPGFDAKRAIIVTNQFGEQVVSVYALGERNAQYALEDLLGRRVETATGVGSNPAASQFQSFGQQPEPVPETPVEPAAPPPDDPDGGGGSPSAALPPAAGSAANRTRRRGRPGGAAPRGFRVPGVSRVRASLAVPACVGVAGLVWSGCSVEKNYELLSFFFDGVPNPKALPITSTGGNPALIRQSPTYSAHRPFLDERCMECHGSNFKTGEVPLDVCLSCHGEVLQAYPRMHGPVPAGACLWCHVPHESAWAHLLKAPSREVCAQCHDSTMLSSSKVPEHQDESRQCLDCHYGHGGTSAYFLRPASDLVKPGAKE